MGLILDILGQDIEAVDLGGKPRVRICAGGAL